jgi:hypothetical protein
MQVAFLTAHLASDTGSLSALNRRHQDAQAILRELVVGYDEVGSELQVIPTLHFVLLIDWTENIFIYLCLPQLCQHHTIFLGDLNYRLGFEDPSTVMNLISRAFSPQPHLESRVQMLSKDQLINARLAGHVFMDWIEEEIVFPPTYRYIKNCTPGSYGVLDNLVKVCLTIFFLLVFSRG